MPENPRDKIHGWNSYAPIFEVLIKAAAPVRTIVEVGSWKGASAIHMLTLCDAEIVCVDTFEGSAEHGNAVPRDSDGKSLLRREFDANIERAGFKDRVTVLQMRSKDAASVIEACDGCVDLIYVDGSHAEEDVAADLAAYWPLVRPGGILFGDDWLEWPSVRRAVENFGPTPSVEGNHWWFVKPALDC